MTAVVLLTAAGRPPWRLDDQQPPPVSYRIDPSVLNGILVAAAVVLALVGIAALVLALRSALAARARRRLTPLELALRAARAALRGDVAARRRALGALSRVIAAESFARRAEAAAWAPPPPSPEQLEAFARAAEQEAR